MKALVTGINGMDGMSTQKVRHYLNNICSNIIFRKGKKNYFEIGCASGSTYISSNFHTGLDSSYVCDLFNEWKNGPDGERIFLENYKNREIPVGIEEMAIPIGWNAPIDSLGNWMKNPIRIENATPDDWKEIADEEIISVPQPSSPSYLDEWLDD